MEIAAILLGSLAWGALCGLVIKNPYVSITAGLVGGGIIGTYLPTLLTVGG